MRPVWFSAMLRFVVLVDDEGPSTASRSVIVFQAEDWPQAKTRAVELGRYMERSYVGGTGHQVRWRLSELETLDMLGDAITDGREVYAEPFELPGGQTFLFDAEFEPADSEPGQSGV